MSGMSGASSTIPTQHQLSQLRVSGGKQSSGVSPIPPTSVRSKGFTTISMNRFASNPTTTRCRCFASKRAGFVTSTIALHFLEGTLEIPTTTITIPKRSENWSNPGLQLWFTPPPPMIAGTAFVATFVIQGPEFRRSQLRDSRGHRRLGRRVVWPVCRAEPTAACRLYRPSVSATCVQATLRARRSWPHNHAGRNGYVCGATINGVNTSGCANPFSPPTGAKAMATLLMPRYWDRGWRRPMPRSQSSSRSQSVFALKLQADAFNVLNRTNFNGLNLTTSNSNFGTISSAFPPRQLQLGLKALFLENKPINKKEEQPRAAPLSSCPLLLLGLFLRSGPCRSSGRG